MIAATVAEGQLSVVKALVEDGHADINMTDNHVCKPLVGLNASV